MAARIVLYGSRRSPFVEKVYRGLMLKRLPFEMHAPHSALDVWRANPVTRKTPALDLDGRRLFDSTLILRALDAHRPEPALVSADALLAAQQRLIEDWADESLYWYGMALRWTVPANARRAVRGFVAAAPASRWRPILRLLLSAFIPRLLRSQIRAQGTGRLPVDMLVHELDGHLADLEKMFGRGPFLFGLNHPSVADLAVYGQLTFLHDEHNPEARTVVERHPALIEMCVRMDALTD